MGKKWSVGLALGAVGLLLAACGISNPGTFTTTVLTGSSLVITNSEGTPTADFDIGTPHCADGEDNDLDGQADTGADPQCDAANDTNERLDGVQAFVAPTWQMAVAGTGAITFDPASMAFPTSEECLNTGLEIWCMGITVVGTGPVQSGTIAPGAGTIELPFSIKVEVDAVVGFPGLSPTCHLGPLSGTLTASDYSTTTGEATLAVADITAPAVSGCGSSGFLNYDQLFNDTLQLPGQADLTFETRTLDGNGKPVS